MKNLTFGGGGGKFFRREQGDSITKNRKNLTQKDGPIPHRQFQHSSSIRKCSKIVGTEPTFGRVLGHPGGRVRFQNGEKYPWALMRRTSIPNCIPIGRWERGEKLREPKTGGEEKWEEELEE